jgi:hypothetical protein
MSSVTSAGLAQIPRNSHFRYILLPGVTQAQQTSSILTFTPTSGVAPVLTNSIGGITGSFTPTTPWSLLGGATFTQATVAPSTPYALMSAGQALFKDMGDTIVSAGRTFRRVQLLNPYAGTTDQNSGTYTGVDTDALAGYIEVGFRGAAFPGPFVRSY